GCRFRWTGRGTADGPHEPGRPEHVRHAGARPLLHRPHHACARNDLPVRPRALRPGLRPAGRIPMITRTQRATYRTASLIVVTAVCAGCMPGTSRGPPSGSHPAGQHAAVITVGSFDFPESMVLAGIYGDALK